MSPETGDFANPLFDAVQRERIFPDSKTFVDCVPTTELAAVLEKFQRARRSGAPLDLRAFVGRHFLLPETRVLSAPSGMRVGQHVDALWKLLRREPDRAVPHSSLLPLPHPYIVPGGRFREVYYWDTYFTMLGLLTSGEDALAESMVDNFAHLIRTRGFVPNGNRTYYLSRSQPPFFSLMVELLAERTGPEVYLRYRDALETEYGFWMDRGVESGRVVELPGGRRLNRYFDPLDGPRPEAYAEDLEWAAKAGPARPGFFREIRAAAESGWDFSSRWFRDGVREETICTTEIVPVDLNSLLYKLESVLAHACGLTGNAVSRARYERAAEARKEAVRAVCWSKEARFFCDYDTVTAATTGRLSLAGVMPLFTNLASPAQAAAVARAIAEKFLRPGGVVTTLRTTGQQWDAPNGWAPLQWCTIHGLQNYGQADLAAEIARRWMKLNSEVFARTGRLLEKYDVVDTTREGGGGEYPNQDGFGWTNGVLRKLMTM